MHVGNIRQLLFFFFIVFDGVHFYTLRRFRLLLRRHVVLEVLEAIASVLTALFFSRFQLSLRFGNLAL